MADVASTVSATVSSTIGKSTATNGDTPGEKSSEKASKRPEKPDEEKYKAALAVAEKEHATAQENLVRPTSLPAPIENPTMNVQTMLIHVMD